MAERGKNTIHSLTNGETFIEGTKNLLNHATAFYKELFGLAKGNLFHLSIDRWSSDEKLSVDDNIILTSVFTEEEVKKALFSMESNRAPGPDDIPVEFYKHYWDFVKGDIMRLFEAFHNNTLDVARLNYGIITLIPKINGAKKIQKYRPICLLRCPYKLITKVLDNRVAVFADKLISKYQNAFIKHRNIMDGILTLHEVLHHTHHKKKTGIVLKLDFEKAYDKINWDFLLECHRNCGFGPTWCGWVEKILHNGTLSIKLNNETGPYFQSHKGVHQGDPYSPFLFNLVVEDLSKMVTNAQKENMITGLAPDLIEGRVAILQYQMIR